MRTSLKKWMNSKTFLKVIIVLVTVFSLPMHAMAQLTWGTGTDVQDTPVDGGISLLVAAGIGYGAKKLYEKKQKRAKETEK